MKESRCFRWRGVAAFTFMLAMTAANALTPLALPDVPIGSAGAVVAIARQSDGGLILGGYFTRIDGVPRRNLARLHADGTLDTNWNPSLDGGVEAIVIDAHDDVIVAGAFNHAGGLQRDSLAKFAGHGPGVLDEAWNPGAVLHSPGLLNMLTIGPDGVFVAGDIFDDQIVDHPVAKIADDGSVDPDWRPSLDGGISAIAADPFGALYVWYGGGTACCLLKLQTSGRGAATPGWHATYDGWALKMTVGADGSLYLAGFDRLVRFTPSSHGEADPTWLPDIAQQGITALAVDGDAVYAALDVAPGADARIVKLTTAAGAATQWQTPGRGVRVLSTGADRSLYAGGMFEGPGGVPPGLQPKLSLARLASMEPSALATVDATLPGIVNAIAIQPDGGTIVGGQFSRAGTTPRTNLARLTADGQLDPDWNAGFDATVLAIAVDAHNAVFVGGYDYLTSPPQERSPALRKFSGSGSGALDTAWNVSTDGAVSALAADAHGSLYVGGSFTSMAGVPRQNVAKLSTHDGAADPAWTAAADDAMNAIVVDDIHRSVYLGSGHIGYPAPGEGGMVYEGVIAKVSADGGSTAGGWSRTLAGVPYALALAPDGSLFAGGVFLTDDATAITDTLKLGSDGAPDAAWSAATSSSTDFRRAFAMVVDPNGDVHAGGLHDFRNDDTSTGHGPYLSKRSGVDGATIAGWNPAVDGSAIRAMALASEGAVDIGGDFSMIDAVPRDGLAALATTPPETPVRGHSEHARPMPVPPQPVASPGRLRPATPAH